LKEYPETKAIYEVSIEAVIGLERKAYLKGWDARQEDVEALQSEIASLRGLYTSISNNLAKAQRALLDT